MEDKDFDDSRVMILGYSKSRLEVFLNGVIFLIIQIAQEVLAVANQLPENWKEEDLSKIDRPFFIPTILFIIAYALMSHALFGGERLENLRKEIGNLGVFLRKLSFLLLLASISALVPVYIILKFF